MAIYRMDFENMLEARRALAKLKELGFNNSYLDIVEKYNEEFSKEIIINSPSSAANTSLFVKLEDDKTEMVKNILNEFR